MPKISIIIPTHKNETAHQKLTEFFETLKDPELEVILCSGKNRANAMNQGATEAQNEFLWFVHADTTLNIDHINILQKQLQEKPDRLHYFDLSFQEDGPWLTKMNAIGANIRSRLFGIPWGDQAFCLPKETFNVLGPYDESALYGEDHLLVWKAHQNKIKLNRISIPVKTSARQYHKKGWLSLTFKRQYLWMKQALPQFVKLIRTWFKK